jgi:cellulose synthase/poly-beta-1,6-N-acetylglucosamine synthase-like glycosyltransferase
MQDVGLLLLLVTYFVVIEVICLYGLHRYWLVWLFVRRRDPLAGVAPRDTYAAEQLPRVTIQLPMFNEANVAERVIEAATAVDYPADRLQVQVLDDSTDESADIARRCCERLAAAGHDIEYRHRDDRAGYKAGALQAGLDTATGELIAVFDADFEPTPTMLRACVDHFTDASVGLVQVRWSHLNRDESLLTRIQAMFLDGHFIVEQTARAMSGRWFNFNGTAGIWRRTAIEGAGGWQCDTLTEDTDLSYRARLAGWTAIYRPDITCPAELPPTMGAFLGQQHRWTKGLIQTAIKLLPRILRSSASPAVKVEAFFHLTCPVVHLFILMLALLVLPALTVAVPTHGLPAGLWFALGLGFLVLGSIAASTFYVASQWAQGRSLWRTLALLPALMAVGIGISVVNTRAIIEALARRTSPFVRTPKFNRATRSTVDPAARGRRAIIPAGVVELLLGGLMIGGFVATFVTPNGLIGAPFIALFAIGFLVVGLGARFPRERRAVPAAALSRSA